MWDLNTENHKTHWKKWKKTEIMEDLVLLRWQFSPKQSTDSINPYQNSNVPFCINGKADSKIYVELQGALNRQNNLEKE